MSGQCECRSKFGESCAFCKGSEEEYPWALDPMRALERAESEYARGKADGMAEARKLDYTEESMRIGGDIELAKVVAWLRAKAKLLLADAAKLSEEPWPKFHESRAVDMAADALERGEHKK